MKYIKKFFDLFRIEHKGNENIAICKNDFISYGEVSREIKSMKLGVGHYLQIHVGYEFYAIIYHKKKKPNRFKINFFLIATPLLRVFYFFFANVFTFILFVIASPFFYHYESGLPKKSDGFVYAFSYYFSLVVTTFGYLALIYFSYKFLSINL